MNEFVNNMLYENEFVNNMLYDIEVTKRNRDTAIQEFNVAINRYYAYINSMKG